MISIRDLEQEIEKLKDQEDKIDSQLRQFFASLSSGQSIRHKSAPIESSDLRSQSQKIEKFAPCFEAMQEDSKKLSSQVDDCRSLSDRISLIVRKLDVKQMRAQQALACAEDIINLKDCRIKLLAAIEEGNLPLAVSFVRQVHDIDLRAATASDDYAAIKEAESNIRELVRSEFNKAISEADTNRVMSLCPLLQTLGLESTARDSFLDYVEQTVFASVSADAAVDGATDPATAYAQALSNIFNSTYSIFQQYLPMIIQGMESSLGDVHFIRRMHNKCQKEASVVFKRYMKFRNLKEIVGGLKFPNAKHPSLAEMHVYLDELALLLQYCCLYSKYLQQLCLGAEARPRKPSAEAEKALTDADAHAGSSSSSAAAGSAVSSASSSSSSTVSFTVFPAGGTQFDRLVEEVINHYYMEAEQWLLFQGMKIGIPRTVDGFASASVKEGVGLDECFFVLRRCGQRAIATNNIQVGCAVTNVISSLLSSNLLGQLSELLASAVSKVLSVVQEHMTRYLKPSGSSGNSGGGGGGGGGASAGSAVSVVGLSGSGEGFSLGLKSAMSMATSLTAGGKSAAALAGKSATGVPATGPDDGDRAAEDDEDDPYQLGQALLGFNMVEICIRYTDRLMREVQQTGSVVFAPVGTALPPSGAKSQATSDFDKIRMSIETIEGSKVLFQQALRKAAERLSSQLQPLVKEVLQNTLGRSAGLGGIRWDHSDESFDAQPALTLLPRSVVSAFETVIAICTTTLSESNKDMIVGVLADACCERLEHFISQVWGLAIRMGRHDLTTYYECNISLTLDYAQNSFRFAGALKFEECVRALTGAFTKASGVPIRGKFSRLREIMLVLTSDVKSDGAMQIENSANLTPNEVVAFLSLRSDATDQ